MVGTTDKTPSGTLKNLLRTLILKTFYFPQEGFDVKNNWLHFNESLEAAY